MRNRKLNRLNNFNYSQNGMYFVTICTKNRECLLGEIVNGKIQLSDIGKNAYKYWLEINNHFPHILLDKFIIMPNHIHGIMEIINYDPVGNKDFCSKNVGNNNYCSLPWQTSWSHSISSAIRGFKIGVKKWCNKNNFEFFQWQKSFYDRVIRNEIELNKIREYIIENPRMWERDRNNQENILM